MLQNEINEFLNKWKSANYLNLLNESCFLDSNRFNNYLKVIKYNLNFNTMSERTKYHIKEMNELDLITFFIDDLNEPLIGFDFYSEPSFTLGQYIKSNLHKAGIINIYMKNFNIYISKNCLTDRLNTINSMLINSGLLISVLYHEYMHYLYETEQTTERFDTMFDDELKASEFNSASKQLFLTLLYDTQGLKNINSFEDLWKFYNQLPNFYLGKAEVLQLTKDDSIIKDILEKYYKDYLKNKSDTKNIQETDEQVDIMALRKKYYPEWFEATMPNKEAFQTTLEDIKRLDKEIKKETGVTLIEFLKKIGCFK